MAVHLKLHDLQTGKADRILRSCLDRLKSHNLVVEMQEKREYFVQEYLPKLDANLASNVNYPTISNLSIYSFDENLLLILKARLYLLFKFTNEKVSSIIVEFIEKIHDSLRKSRTDQTRLTSAQTPSAQGLRTPSQP